MRFQEVRTRRGAPGVLRPVCSLAAPRERRESALRPAHSVWGGKRIRAGVPAHGPQACGHSGALRDAAAHARAAGISAHAPALPRLRVGWPFSPPAFWGSRPRRPLQTFLLSAFKLERHSEPLRERRCPLRPPARPCLGCRVPGGDDRQTPGAGPQPLRSPSASPVGSGPEGSLESWAPAGRRARGGGSSGPGLGGRHRGPRPRAIWTPSAGAFEVVGGGGLFVRQAALARGLEVVYGFDAFEPIPR